MDFWSTNLSWLILGGVVLLFFLKGKILSKLFSFQTISSTHAKELLADSDAQLVDVRTPEEYRASHLPESISIPLSIFDQKIDHLLEKYNDKKLILICQSGTRSLFGALKLGRAGHKKTYSINGGLISW